MTAEPAAQIRWLVADHLGAPRMAADAAGALGGVTRHDYLPFGRELTAGVGGRSAARGYGPAEEVRQKFTSYERDGETGLDHSPARKYSPAHGRFTSPDPFGGSGLAPAPQSWNRYTYCLNRPLLLTDPLGLMWLTRDERSYFWVDDDYYQQNEQKFIDEGYRIGNGAVIRLADTGPRYSQYGHLVGGYVRLNESGTISAVPDPGFGAEVFEDTERFSVALGTLKYDGDTSDRLHGPPGGFRRIDRTIRWYDDEGRAIVDIDHHPAHGGETEPHVHWWVWPGGVPTRVKGWEPVPDGTPVIDTYEDGVPVHNPFWDEEHPAGMPIMPMGRPAPVRGMVPLRPSIPLRPIFVP